MGHFLQISQKRSTVFQKLKVAKLNTYRFIDPALKLIHNYLSKRFFKVNYSYNTWSEILFGVTQDLTLGPISFKIFLSNLFLIMNDVNFICNADDIYDFVESKNNIVLSLQESTKLIFQLFSDNQVKKNTDKCHLIMSTDEQRQILVEDSSIKRNSCKKLLGVKIDSKPNFDGHVKIICSRLETRKEH